MTSIRGRVLLGAAIALAVAAVGSVLYLRPGSTNTVKEQSIPPLFVTPVGADGDLMNVEVGFPWQEQGFCVGQFRVKATESASQVRVGDVVSRIDTGGACAGIGTNGRWATAPLALRAPIGDRQVVRDKDGTPLPVFALTVRLRCGDAITSQAAPGPNDMPIFNEIALPKNALQANESGEQDPSARWFAKSGLLVAPGANIMIAVPESLMGKASIGWGSPATHAMALFISGCPAGDRWLVFAGGFWVSDPACIPILVHTVTLHQTVMIGAGKACPGQTEPSPGT